MQHIVDHIFITTLQHTTEHVFSSFWYSIPPQPPLSSAPKTADAQPIRQPTAATSDLHAPQASSYAVNTSAAPTTTAPATQASTPDGASAAAAAFTLATAYTATSTASRKSATAVAAAPQAAAARSRRTHPVCPSKSCTFPRRHISGNLVPIPLYLATRFSSKPQGAIKMCVKLDNKETSHTVTAVTEKIEACSTMLLVSVPDCLSALVKGMFLHSWASTKDKLMLKTLTTNQIDFTCEACTSQLVSG